MTTFEPGEVVLLRFPFTDLHSSKKRPALVVSPLPFQLTCQDVVVLALTSQSQMEAKLALRHWQSARLLKPTWIKPLVATIAIEVVDRSIGKLDERDHPSVVAALRQLFAPPYWGP